MQIRLQLKTHYQINRPGIFSVLLLKCTSPSKTEYPEIVSARLAQVGFNEISINKESAKFAVSIAEGFEFLTSNMFWAWKGQALNIILQQRVRDTIDGYLKLEEAERILYLKYYLEADGAAILEVCKHLVSMGKISRHELLSTNFIDNVFIEIWETYRGLASDLRVKIQLRENVRKIKAKPYTYKTRIHKALFHIESLTDFNIVGRQEEKNEIWFYKLDNMERLTKELASIAEMERKFSKGAYFEVVANILNLKFRKYDRETDSEVTRNKIISYYLKARSAPSQMASISVISDALCSCLLSEASILIGRQEIEEEIGRLKMENPNGLHFHVDRDGRRAFIVMSDKLLKSRGDKS